MGRHDYRTRYTHAIEYDAQLISENLTRLLISDKNGSFLSKQSKNFLIVDILQVQFANPRQETSAFLNKVQNYNHLCSPGRFLLDMHAVVGFSTNRLLKNN
jgi:hypothetical protein